MSQIVLRGRLKRNGEIELIDPLPDNLDVPVEVSVIVKTSVGYETVNEYGNRVIVDEMAGTITPLEPLTTDELLSSPVIGIWADRRDERGNLLK